MLTENLLQTALTHVQLLASTYILNVHFLKYEFHQLKSYLHKIIWKGFVTPIFNFVTPLLKLLRETICFLKYLGHSLVHFFLVSLLLQYMLLTIENDYSWVPRPRAYFFSKYLPHSAPRLSCFLLCESNS